jgi:uncharacterized protein (TIGR02271 family)
MDRDAPGGENGGLEHENGEPRTLRLHREELIAKKEPRVVGYVEIGTTTEELPGRLEVEAARQEVQIEHVPVGREVSEREGPREDGGVLIVPVYEERLVVSKRLVLKEELHVRRIERRERHLFVDSLRREVVDIRRTDADAPVTERYPTAEKSS